MDIGSVGVWSTQLRWGDAGEIADAAAELDELGFGALWFPGGAGGDVFGAAQRLLTATQRAVVATGILNLWMHEPDEVAAQHAQLQATHDGRFLLGLGVSHAALIDRDEKRYRRPLARVRSYLDALDAAEPRVPERERVLAALGPKMLALAAERTAGAHPYLVTPEHTRRAREVLGDRALLAPEAKVVLERDATRARAIAREHLAIYLDLPNYTRNLARLGFTDEDLSDGGSDRLVDAVVAWGDLDTVAARVREHHDAGANHVCVQVLGQDRTSLPRDAWRALAPAVLPG